MLNFSIKFSNVERKSDKLNDSTNTIVTGNGIIGNKQKRKDKRLPISVTNQFDYQSPNVPAELNSCSLIARSSIISTARYRSKLTIVA